MQPYRQMVEDLKKADAKEKYKIVLSCIKLIKELFGVSNEKLVISNDEVYFADNDQHLTNFGAVVLNVTHIHQIEGKKYDLELLILSQNDKATIVHVDSLSLTSNRWIEILGASYWYIKIHCIQKAIKIMAEFAPASIEYHYSGWAIDKSDTYILRGQELCAKNVISIENDSTIACKYVFTMLDIAERRITIPLLAVALLSLVQSKLIEVGEFFKGVFCLEGQSQSGKTQLFNLFFDFERGKETDTNFESTEKAIIRIISNKRDATATIDDYKPTSTGSARNNQMKTLEKVIRMCGDDSHGYQKAGSGNSTVAEIAHCIVAITAEEIRLPVQSTLARLLLVDITRKSMDWQALTKCQEKHDSYRAFIINYILHISSQGVANFCDNLAKRFVKDRCILRKLLDKDKGINSDNRSSDQCTWLYISFDLFLNYALEVNAIGKDQFERYNQESLQIFLDLLAEQSERISELDDVTRFFRGLRNLLDMKEARIEKLQARNNGYASQASKAAIGFSKKGFILLKNEVAFQQVTSYFKKYGKNFVMSEATLRKRLNDEGHLVMNTKTPKSPIYRLSVNHENYQCTKFKEETFYKLLKGGKNSDTGNEKEVQRDRLVRENADNYI